MFDKEVAKRRIKRALKTGQFQVRVRFVDQSGSLTKSVSEADGKRGYYLVKHHVKLVPFRFDSLNRVYFPKNV